MITRKIVCDICGNYHQEEADGAGFPGWGALQGVALDGVANPTLCPMCLGALADLADRLKEAANAAG